MELCKFVFTKACKGGLVGTACGHTEEDHCGDHLVHDMWLHPSACRKMHHPFHRSSKVKPFREKMLANIAKRTP